MLEDTSCTFIVKMSGWTPDMISDFVDGVNKFRHSGKRIKLKRLKACHKRHLVTLEDEKQKVEPGDYNCIISTFGCVEGQYAILD